MRHKTSDLCSFMVYCKVLRFMGTRNFSDINVHKCEGFHGDRWLPENKEQKSQGCLHCYNLIKVKKQDIPKELRRDMGLLNDDEFKERIERTIKHYRYYASFDVEHTSTKKMPYWVYLSNNYRDNHDEA